MDCGSRYENPVQTDVLNPADIWLMEEGHCMRTQILNFCDLDKNYSNTHLNFNFKAGSIDSLVRFVKANQATTLKRRVLYFLEQEILKQVKPLLPTITKSKTLHPI